MKWRKAVHSYLEQSIVLEKNTRKINRFILILLLSVWSKYDAVFGVTNCKFRIWEQKPQFLQIFDFYVFDCTIAQNILLLITALHIKLNALNYDIQTF